MIFYVSQDHKILIAMQSTISNDLHVLALLRTRVETFVVNNKYFRVSPGLSVSVTKQDQKDLLNFPSHKNHNIAIAMNSFSRADTDSVLAGGIQMFISVSLY